MDWVCVKLVFRNRGNDTFLVIWKPKPGRCCIRLTFLVCFLICELEDQSLDWLKGKQRGRSWGAVCDPLPLTFCISPLPSTHIFPPSCPRRKFSQAGTFSYFKPSLLSFLSSYPHHTFLHSTCLLLFKNGSHWTSSSTSCYDTTCHRGISSFPPSPSCSLWTLTL